jgi:hypothetical protein
VKPLFVKLTVKPFFVTSKNEEVTNNGRRSPSRSKITLPPLDKENVRFRILSAIALPFLRSNVGSSKIVSFKTFENRRFMFVYKVVELRFDNPIEFNLNVPGPEPPERLWCISVEAEATLTKNGNCRTF